MSLPVRRRLTIKQPPLDSKQAAPDWEAGMAHRLPLGDMRLCGVLPNKLTHLQINRLTNEHTTKLTNQQTSTLTN